MDGHELIANPTQTFSIKCPQDEETNVITGIVSLQSRDIVVVDNQNNVLKLFSSEGEYISSTEDPQTTMGITEMAGDDFATCGWDREIYLWTVRDQTIIRLEDMYEVDADADGIGFNGDHFCVLHRFDNKITILDKKGTGQNKLIIKEAFGKRVNFGYDIQMDELSHIYIPCVEESKGVLCTTITGTVLWHCSLPNNVDGMTRIGNLLCVADKEAKCVHTIDKEGMYIDTLISKTNLKCGPSEICFGRSSGNMYVSYDVWSDMKGKVTVFTIL